GGTPKAEGDTLRASGLLRLAIPARFGGGGGDWPTVMRTVRLLATSDSSVAHVYAFHHLMLATVRLFSRPEQWQPWFEHTAAHDWFWGNALNPLDERTVARRFDGWREFSGRKSFCSGATDSEMLIASALDQDTRQLLVAAVPTLRSGISVHADWDNIGQRQTDSGSVDFERVRVEEHEILADPGPLSTPFSCLRPLLAQLILANIYLGIAEGAYQDARHYTLNEARPWHRAQVEQSWQDPYVLNHYGEFWAGLEGVRSLIERAAAHFEAAWRQGEALDEAGRGEVALAIAAAKVAATRVGLDVTSRMFDVTGARSTHAGLRLDRHWRNLRTHTLHDPVDYKLRELGEWALLQHYPTPSFYS
ncbi:acyl-CoA dehydrogenase family protein, partial [Chitiniphilus shinanonensis]|uniref:acyl-CoA dehydrogenase family protein n=1 Tax=Chitiniphilus shinanonensis TaxID=553088 RepID=UPI0024E0555C